ncbi:intracellular septation protein A [Sinobacterium norvegicum]|uniref:Intracellular septation protein A n=1 Tax=Sinobacterium norvegicum TaxID=1641715 RepID=A0ABN8EHP4_9GAMM|nr:septation protein IspZ [Sinobacterium norvegicum]CAH0991519.1 intracellular septation protein A [Sinobacterium norvegicum]
MKVLLNVTVGIVIAVYPLAVFFGLSYFSIAQLTSMLALIFLLRLASLWSSQSPVKHLLAVGCVMGGVLAGLSYYFQSSDFFRYYPVVVNAIMATAFAASLLRGMPMVERLARLKESELDASGVAYTRIVTKAWLLFFIVNGLFALYTAGYTSFEFWTLYNGLLSYLLMALLFAVEWFVRQHVRRQQH